MFNWKAKEKGADVVKQWDSSLDGKTRDTHRQLDGQIRELDEPFEIGGMKAMQPGGFGRPEEDCNCRCALLQRARWALGNDYTKWSADAPVMISDDGTTQFVDMSDSKNYKEFKDHYAQASNRVRSSAQMMNDVDILFKDKENSTISSKQKFEDTMVVSNSYKKLPVKVKTSINDVIFEFGYNSNGCDIEGKTIRVGIGTTEECINHEYGHLIEHYMMKKEDVDAYKMSLTSGLSYANIKKNIS